MVLFQKNLPPEINDNNYNYSKIAKQPFCCSSEEGITIRRKQNSVLEICISRHESNCRRIFETEDRKKCLWTLKLLPNCEYYAVCVCRVNTGQRLFCVIQWYCINIPEHVHTIAAQAIMPLFNWKLIKYINKNRGKGFFLFRTAVIESIHLYIWQFYSVLVCFCILLSAR